MSDQWPTRCPKCGLHAAPPYGLTFAVSYCAGCPTRPATFGGSWRESEHLHHHCPRCGHQQITRCVDAPIRAPELGEP